MTRERNMNALRLLSILSVTAATAAIGQESEIARSTIDGGGVMRSIGTGFELSGTVGQPDAAIMLSADGVFELTGGFWFGEPLDDCNSDGWIDLIDYDDFDDCLSGPAGGLPLPQCNCFDLDSDSDVDLLDVWRFQEAFSGT